MAAATAPAVSNHNKGATRLRIDQIGVLPRLSIWEADKQYLDDNDNDKRSKHQYSNPMFCFSEWGASSFVKHVADKTCKTNNQIQDSNIIFC